MFFERLSRLNLALLCLLVLFCFLNGSSSAITISPELRAKLQKEGVWDQFSQKFRRWQEQLEGQSPVYDRGMALAKGTTSPNVVTMQVCVLLVDFSDKPASAGPVTNLTAAGVDDILFSQGTYPTGSMQDFYRENSFNQFIVDGGVYGWFRMPKTYAQYTGSDNGMQGVEPNAQTLLKDAVAAADPTVNFAPFDNDGNGRVDIIFLIHAGAGAEETGAGIWSHRWNAGSIVGTSDGKTAFDYLVCPEEVAGGVMRIGVFAHEYGHALGLPDLYDIDNDFPGLGSWSLMATGSWNYGQRSPAHFDGWCKHYLDSVYHTFGKTVEVTSNLTDVILNSSVTDSVRYRIKMPGATGKEYFIIENRQQVGFDTYLPGGGLLILHCDDFLSGSNSIPARGHWRVSVVEADGLDNLRNDQGSGDNGDLFPTWENDVLEWTNLSYPSTASWYSTPNEISVWNIRHDTGNKRITANFDLSYSRTNLLLQSNTFSDISAGNGDGIFDKGEFITVSYSFKNFWKTATGVSMKLSSPTPGITVMAGTNDHGTVNNGATVNSTSLLSFQISPSITPVNATFYLDIISTNPADTFRTVAQHFVGGAEILVVDADDASGAADRLPWVDASLDSLLLPYALWDVQTMGTPAAPQYAYKYIIWFTGDVRADLADVISPAEVSFLRGYLDQGGKLYISGQDVAERLSQTADSTFLRDYLGARYDSDYLTGPLDASGVASNPMSAGVKLRVRGPNGAANQLDNDFLRFIPNVTPAYYYTVNDSLVGPAGCSFARPNGSRVVFTSFGVEAPTTNHVASGYNTRHFFLQKVLNFLNDNTSTDVDDITDGIPLPVYFTLEQNYPNPFNPTTQIEYNVEERLQGAPMTLSVYNILGQQVAELQNERAIAGRHSVEFDASSFASGVYFYRLRIGNNAVTKKMILSK